MPKNDAKALLFEALRSNLPACADMSDEQLLTTIGNAKLIGDLAEVFSAMVEANLRLEFGDDFAVTDALMIAAARYHLELVKIDLRERGDRVSVRSLLGNLDFLQNAFDDQYVHHRREVA